MKGNLISLAITVLIATGILFIFQSQEAVIDDGQIREPLTIVRQDGTRHAFMVEIAATPEQQRQGLMFRKHMEADHGMLFQMNQTAVYRFWMKNTLIPLDMLFIAGDGTIKTIQANAVPETLTPRSSEVPVAAVLELNGGRAAALGITPGDRVLHAYFGTVSP